MKHSPEMAVSASAGNKPQRGTGPLYPKDSDVNQDWVCFDCGTEATTVTPASADARLVAWRAKQEHRRLSPLCAGTPCFRMMTPADRVADNGKRAETTARLVDQPAAAD